MNMFCYQCEQAAGGAGCTKVGVCGKKPEVAALQDLLVHVSKGVSQYAHRARELDTADHDVDVFVVKALFATVTNVDFDPTRLEALIHEGVRVKDRARAMYRKALAAVGGNEELPSSCAAWEPSGEDLVSQGAAVSIRNRAGRQGEDVTGLQELLLYGLKGTAAYADHAMILGRESDDVYAFFHEALDFLAREEADVDRLLTMILRCGAVNLKVMEMLDGAHTGTFGHPEPTAVRIEPRKGKAILVSGHDLKDLDELLRQTEGKGINVYTHGEMLPAHGYPGLKRYPHLAGNYGGAWQDQQKEFDAFPGAIVMTTNCIQKPRDSYRGRLFTSGLVGWPDVVHIPDRDFTPAIEAALAAPGFAEEGSDRTITVGFGREAVLGSADKIVDAVRAGKIRHFFLVGGCDGAKSGRNYYTRFAEAVPDDCVIMTLACGKYRFNKLEFGDIDGIPRLLDCGQCNDAYSAIRVALALADAFDTDVNGLPLSFILSWYEQKAVCILLTLLYLGVREIKLGPSLPAFVTPAVLQVLADKFKMAPISTVEQDMAAALGDATP